MAITKTIWNADGSRTPGTLFANRVVEVAVTLETRNWSDTLDYSDFRDTRCTYALVWLGTHNYAPERRSKASRLMAYYDSLKLEGEFKSNWVETRDLEFHEQFAWVDCTNILSDRNGFSLSAEVDGAFGTFGDPLMWANLIAWRAHEAGLAKAAEEEARKAKEAREAAAAKEKAQRVARETKRQAKIDAGKPAVEAAMALTPEKGTVCTVDGFTGKVFWKGTKVYRGAWRGTVGLKNERGEVRWIDVGHWAKEEK